MKNEPVTKQSDVYSYGVVLWELMTHKVPFPDLTGPAVMSEVLAGQVGDSSCEIMTLVIEEESLNLISDMLSQLLYSSHLHVAMHAPKSCEELSFNHNFHTLLVQILCLLLVLLFSNCT